MKDSILRIVKSLFGLVALVIESLFRTIVIFFKYFDLLFKYSSVKILKPLLYFVYLIIFIPGFIGLSMVIGSANEYSFDEFIYTISLGILLLILARFLFHVSDFLKLVISLERLTRHRGEDLLDYHFIDDDESIERLESLDQFRRMDIGYFKPKFWFISEKRFENDLKKFKSFVKRVSSNEPKIIDEVVGRYWHQEEFKKIAHDFKEYKSRQMQYRNAIQSYNYDSPKNFVWEAEISYRNQLRKSISRDLSYRNKKRSSNQKKLLEIINEDSRQFYIDALFAFYNEKYRNYPKRRDEFWNSDRKIKYEIGKSSIVIETNVTNKLEFTYQYRSIFDE